MRKHSVGILLFEDVEVLDFAGPFEVFSRTRLVPGVESRRSDDEAPFQVFTVGTGSSGSSLAATGGLRLVPDYGLDDAPRIDILVVPGGFGTRPLLKDPGVLSWVRSRAEAATWLTSVCTGALLLAKLGLLKGKRATTHWGALEFLAAIDSEVTVVKDSRIVHDTVVTSAGVSAGIEMALYVVQQICGREVAEETAQYIEYPYWPQS